MPDKAPESQILELLKQWRQFVNALERDSNKSLAEYQQDLSIRDTIATLQTTQLSQSTTLKLKDLDRRFNHLTIDRYGSTPDPQHPWRTRVPRRPGKDLANQLAIEILALIQNSPIPTGHTKIDEAAWPPHVWVFNGARQAVASATFSTKKAADAWIATNRLSGMLTAYPLDIGVHEWTVAKGYFKADEPRRQVPTFIADFCSAHLPHFHYENGFEESGGTGSSL